MEFKFLSQIALKVTNIHKAMDFYCGKLGFRHIFNFYREDGTPWMYYLRISHCQYLELIPVDSEPQAADQSFLELTLQVEDIDAAAGMMGADTICILPRGSRSFAAEDPDGNRIRFLQISGQSRQAEREGGIPEKGECGVNSITLRTANMEQTERFYTQGLGLEKVYTYPGEKGLITGFRVAPFAYIQLLYDRGFVPARGGSFHHAALIVEDVKKAAAEAIEKGMRLYHGPAELGNRLTDAGEISAGLCNSPSFYLEDTDLNAIEIMQFVENSRQLEYEKQYKE